MTFKIFKNGFPKRIYFHVLAFVIPTLIALGSLHVAFLSLQESRKTNEMNEERLRIVVSPNWEKDPIGTPQCGYTVTIPLTWKVLVFNNSTQPVTIENISFIGFSTNGMVVPLDADNDKPAPNFSTPFIIAAKDFKSFSTTVDVNTPESFATWYRQTGLCNSKVMNHRKVAESAGFTSTGGTATKPSRAGVAVKIATSDGYEVSTQAEWGVPMSSTGPNVMLPSQ